MNIHFKINAKAFFTPTLLKKTNKPNLKKASELKDVYKLYKNIINI